MFCHPQEDYEKSCRGLQLEDDYMFEFEGFCTLYADCAYISAHENNSVICEFLKTKLHS